MWALVSHISVGWGWRTALSSACGIEITKFCPRVNLSASLTSNITAATMHRQAGYPAATRSNFLDKYATGGFQGPNLWVRTPFGKPLLSATNRWKGSVTSWRPKAGADIRAVLMALKACCSLFLHMKGCLSLRGDKTGLLIQQKLESTVCKSLQCPGKL